MHGCVHAMEIFRFPFASEAFIVLVTKGVENIGHARQISLFSREISLI